MPPGAVSSGQTRAHASLVANSCIPKCNRANQGVRECPSEPGRASPSQYGTCAMLPVQAHVEVHPWLVPFNYSRLSVRGPIWDHAPLPKGFKHFFNFAPTLWRGQRWNRMISCRLCPRWPFPAIRGRPRRLTVIDLAAFQAEKKTTRITTTIGQHVTHAIILSPSRIYNQSNM